MTDVLINGHGKPLSMSPAAIRQRNKRARDRCVTTVTRPAPPGQRDASRRHAGTVLRFNGSHTRDSQGPTVTPVQNHQLNGVTPLRAQGVTPHLSPSIVPGYGHESPSLLAPVSSRWRDGLLRVACYVTGMLLATAGLGSNASYTFSQGRDLNEYLVLGAFAVGMEIATMILPVVISRMWRQRNYGHVLIGMFMLIISGLAVGMAAAGFVQRTFGDAAAARGKGVAQYADLEADLRSARAKRLELKFVPTTQAAVDAAQASVTTECWRKRDSEECARRRGALADLSGRLAAGVRDDKLAADIVRLEAARGMAAPLANFADPQIESVKGIVSQVSRHSSELDPGDVNLMRIFWFAALPMLAGLMFAWADAIGEPRERKRVVADDGFRNRSRGIDSNLAGQVA